MAKGATQYVNLPYTVKGMDLSFSGLLTSAIRKYESGESIENVCYSLQETAFSMLVEVTERAIAHAKKEEVMLCGGVAANTRLREMVSIMSEEHYAEFFMPPIKYCGDNGAMIAWMGQLMYKNGFVDEINNTRVIQKYRTDQVDVPWVKNSKKQLKLPVGIVEKGAEANIYSGQWMDESVIIKNRLRKNYRIEDIDRHLRKIRTKGESKLLGEAKKCGVKTPIVFDVDKIENSIVMEKIHGTLVKDIIDTEDLNTVKGVCVKIGENLAQLHNCGIIHGDLTSSNLILNGDDLYFIDFGLGNVSDLVEDKGVDLLVFKKAISSLHNEISDECYESIIRGYKKARDYESVIKKVKEIENRGRYTVNEDDF